MADKRITDLNPLLAADGDDVLVIVDSSANETKKITKTDFVSDLKTTPAGTAGQIQFSDGSAFAADSNLFWDNTNKRLGVGTSTPQDKIEVNGNIRVSANAFVYSSASGGAVSSGMRFDSATPKASVFVGSAERVIFGNSTIATIKGSGSTSATTSLLVQNSSGTDAFKVTDDREVTIENNLKLKSILARNSADLGRIYLQTWGNGYLNVTNDGVAVSIGSLLAPDSSAIIDATSTTKGFLPPRMTTTQKSAISAPASGLQVFDTDTAEQNIYDGSGWRNVIAGDNTNLVWDNTNKRLGVGGTTPTARVQIKGEGTTSSSYSFIAKNLSDIEKFIIDDSGTRKISISSSGLDFRSSSDNSARLTLSNSVNTFDFSTWNSSFLSFAGTNVNAVQVGNISSSMGAKFGIKGSGSTSATTALLVQNSSGTELLKVLDGGSQKVVTIGSALIGNLSYFGNIVESTSTQTFKANGVAINGDYSTPESTAMLEVKSTTKGFLPPRMTTTQKNAISTPAAGLMVYDTDTNKLCCYNGTTWNDLF